MYRGTSVGWLNPKHITQGAKANGVVVLVKPRTSTSGGSFSSLKQLSDFKYSKHTKFPYHFGCPTFHRLLFAPPSRAPCRSSPSAQRPQSLGLLPHSRPVAMSCTPCYFCREREGERISLNRLGESAQLV